jgi:integrase
MVGALPTFTALVLGSACLVSTAAAASIAADSSAPSEVKVVQQMLSHKSATMTLDQYSHLFGDRLDVVADAMDAAREKALADVSPMCQEAEVVSMK